MLEPRILVPHILEPMLVPLILDYIFNSFSLKFGRREIYDGNLHSEIHKEFITTLLNQHSDYDDKSDSLIEITELESGNETNYDNDNDNNKYNYDEVETLAFHLSLQLNLLEKRGYTMLYLQPSHIVKIRCRSRCRYMYLLVDLTQLVPLSTIDSNNLVLNYPEIYPFPKGVCAPELYTIGVLPFITHRSASYYSLGLLCLYFLHHQNLSLNHLRDTPLFYFLERCLKEEPIERRCIFI